MVQTGPRHDRQTEVVLKPARHESFFREASDVEYVDEFRGALAGGVDDARRRSDANLVGGRVVGPDWSGESRNAVHSALEDARAAARTRA